jgi:hypothetical protein
MPQVRRNVSLEIVPVLGNWLMMRLSVAAAVVVRDVRSWLAGYAERQEVINHHG